MTAPGNFRFLLETTVFRCYLYVSFRECSIPTNWDIININDHLKNLSPSDSSFAILQGSAVLRPWAMRQNGGRRCGGRV